VLRLDWNSLRAGDRLLVHHSDVDAVRLLAGVVTSVTLADGCNEVEVRVTTNSGTRVFRPQRLMVHHDPIEFEGHCWRCATLSPPAARAKPRGA
jgi:hypothetical protein